MECVWFQVESGHLRSGDFDSCRIGSLCHLCLDLGPRRGFGICDQIDDGLVAYQRGCSPVLRDEGKHAVFDLVPLAGSGRKMRYLNMLAGEICQTP